MMSEPDSLQQPRIEADSMPRLTPVMNETEVAHATELSMAHARPPLRVPGYEKEQFLGRGAFGEVWKAIDSNSGRVVAIKFYSRRGGLDWSHMSREVEKLQFLFSDRHVVQLFDVGWKATPPYYVMEYLENGSLEDRLQSGPMSVTEAVSMIRNISLGLSRAHDLGILHCDLKPDNIMLDNEGKPRLADFGQSRLKHEHAPAVGTLFYMAPEQAELSMVPDARWDVYALGAILYRMVTGKLPYLTKDSADSVSSQGSVDKRLRAYSQLLKTSPPPTDHRHVPGVDADLSRIIDRCLAVNPNRRYPNVQSVLHALALRDSKMSQRPLLMVGILGPAIVIIVLTLVSVLLFNQTLRTARSLLLDRTYESNQFAARSVASRFAMDIDRRWQILEQEATHEPLIEWLQQAGEPPNADAPTRPPAAIAEWLDRRFEHWNAQFSRQTTASYWYVLDRNGTLRAITPSGQEVLGQYFGYREYFHGQGRQLNRNEAVPPMITAAHRSNAFRSQPLNRPSVSLSVPIHGLDGQSIVGVLVMEAELGHFAEFQGARNQVAVLVDLRPDESQRRGLILEHPHFDEHLRTKTRLEEIYIPDHTLKILDSIQQREHDAANGDSQKGISRGIELTVLDAYADPVTDGSRKDLIAVVEPVFIRREGNQLLDSGWVLLLQEQRAEILEPINRLLPVVTYGSAAALLLVMLIMSGLWWLVSIVQNAPNRLRASQLWGSQFTSSSTTGLSSQTPTRTGDSVPKVVTGADAADVNRAKAQPPNDPPHDLPKAASS